MQKQKATRFPEFVFAERDANPAFAELVKTAVRSFDFTELSDAEQLCFQLMRQHGYSSIVEFLRSVMAEIRQEDPESIPGKAADAIWGLRMGDIILGKVPEEERRKHLPFNDVRFLYVGTQIVVEFRSLLEDLTGGVPFYYSRRKPTVEVDGKPYIIAFSPHAIEQTCNRIVPDWLTCSGLGDAFAYFEQCMLFEPCRLLNGYLAFTFYDACGDRRFWQHEYVKKVLGEENLDPRKGAPYYRVGYCPADLDGDFIRARTLLFPGYRQTPEYGVLRASFAWRREQVRLADMATKSDAKTLIDVGDFSALKWFHANGVPQVIETNRPVYDHSVSFRQPA